MVDEPVRLDDDYEHAYHEEDTQAPLFRRLAAEFMGTLIFVAVGTGAATVFLLGPLQLFEQFPEALRQSPENSAAFSTLIQNSFSDVLPVAFAFGATLAMLIYAMGGVSGAHFNPAVTFALAIGNRFKWGEVPMYWVAQILGGIAGAFVVAGIYGQSGASLGGTDILFGATTVAENIDQWQAVLAEALIAFVLMSAVMAVAVDHRAPKGWSGLIIGLALAGGIMVTAAATGGSANFARTLGPFVASLRYDIEGSIPWGDLWIYAVGPVVGAAAAGLVYESVTGLERVGPAPSPGAATTDDDLGARPPVDL